MFFWKIDDETIRCLIHKEEISNMGFDLQGDQHGQPADGGVSH